MVSTTRRRPRKRHLYTSTIKSAIHTAKNIRSPRIGLPLVNLSVTDLSSSTSPDDLISALGRGLSFVPNVPVSSRTVRNSLLNGFKQYANQLRTKLFFLDCDDPVRSKLEQDLYLKSNWVAPCNNASSAEIALNSYITLTEKALLNSTRRLKMFSYSNISKSELDSLKAASSDSCTVVAQSDKNLGAVLVDTSWYNEQLSVHLSNATVYTKVDTVTALSIVTALVAKIDVWLMRLNNYYDTYVPTSEINATLIDKWSFSSATNVSLKLLELAKATNCTKIPHSVQSFIESFKPSSITESTVKWNKMYLLIKIHKSPVATRPIVPSLNWPTTGVSKWIDCTLQPFISMSPYVCTGSLDIILDLKDKVVPPSVSFVTLDVVSLYPSIPLNETTWRLLFLLFTKTFLLTTNLSYLLIDALKLVLFNHIIRVDDVFYLQKSGTAMGVACAVMFAQCFMLAFEIEHGLHRLSCFYKRYIDDIIAWVPTEHVAEFVEKCMDADNNIKFTFDTSETRFDFLDLTWFKGPNFMQSNILDSRLFVKPLNKFLHLPYSSMHPSSTLSGMIHGNAIRIVRASSSHAIFKQDIEAFIKQLLLRGYPLKFIKRSLNTVCFENRSNFLLPKNSSVKNPLIFNVPFSDSIAHLHLGHVLRKYWDIIDNDPDLSRAFKPPLLAFSRSPNLGELCKHWSQ